MAVKKPSKILGRSIALKSAQKHLQGKTARVAYATLNLTAMVDMFTILVVFLLANFSATGEILFMSKTIQLPKADATAEILRAPVVSVSASEIALEGKWIVATDDVSATGGSVGLTDLTDGLREIRRAEEMLRPGQESKATVILQADQEVQFVVIKRVMYAAAAAGYGNINYAVVSRGRGAVGATK